MSAPDYGRYAPLAFLLAVLAFLAALYVALRIGGAFDTGPVS